jgi:hypothetical protein
MNKKTIIIILIVLVLVLVGYLALQGLTGTTGENTIDNNTSPSTAYEQATTTDTQLTALEEENNAQDFSSIESDFGAEVNAAAQ